MSYYTIDPVVNGQRKQQVVKVGDTLPIGTEVDYEGSVVPNGWEEVSDPNEYSTTEQVVGKTSDGKTIYRKEFNFTDLPVNTNNDLDTTQITGVDFTKIVKIDGFVKGGASNFIAPLNTIFTTSDLTSGRITHYAIGTKFRSYAGSFLTGNNKYDLTLWLYYTKV